ncbi:MAG: addiction module protein [Spirochaetota bacterium]|nr:addiction module protein [Spirochaetota bacterium]
MNSIKKIFSEAESLPIDLKTQLIEKLLNSLNPSKKEIDKLWSKVAETRVGEIKSGKEKPIPGEEVFREIQKHFSK